MLNILTGKRPNGRQMLILILEPQDMDHVKTGQVVVADSSKVEGVDVLVSYVPDGARLEQMMKQEMPNMRADTFQRIMLMAQQYPEVRRAAKTNNVMEYKKQ